MPEDYQRQADALFAALNAGDRAAAWRFKWEHPRFKGRGVDDVRAARLDPDDARMVIAQEQAFNSWDELARFVPDTPFEQAVDALVSGDAATLASMIRENPRLVRERSLRRHHATLLHYIAANGVEGVRQRTPANAVEMARMLLDAGSEVDALADMYEHKCTTMSMLVSSTPPADAGLQLKLAETLLDYGAACEGAGTGWQSAVETALVFGFLATAEGLANRCAPRSLGAAAGLGRDADVARLLPGADARSRHVALALAAQLGQESAVRLLLDAGEDPNRYNPDGCHSHATPLHQAVWAGHMNVVRLLVARGARLDMTDKVYQGTPLDWAVYGKREAVAEFLRKA